MLRVVCASSNPHKVAEINELITALTNGLVNLVARPADLGDVDETENTLIGNARLKAVAVCTATNSPALADDTGLEVDALNGAPGVWSARFAGAGATDAQNRAKLLKALTPIAKDRRTARFRTVVILRWPDSKEIICQGVCEGSIATSERGERGFGYDSLFIPSLGDGRTFAEMSIEEKHLISHRGNAFRALAQAVANLPTA